jgi:hypothetical protein
MTLWRREKSLAPAGNRTPAVQPSLYRLSYPGFNVSTYIINGRLSFEFSTGIEMMVIVEDILHETLNRELDFPRNNFSDL